MNNIPTAYGSLCSLFYDATKAYAPQTEVDFYSHFINKQPGRVLEAMSGSGRLQIPLIQKGFIVDGVDNSTSMIARFKERCAQLRITADIYEQSLEELLLPHKYSIVTIAVGSFQLIIEHEAALKALKNLHKHMTTNGTVLIDIFTPDIQQPERSVRFAQIDHRTKIRLTTRHIFDIEKQQADSFFLYELLVNGLVQAQENELIQVVWKTDEQWRELLNQAGFTIRAFHDVMFRISGPSRVIEAQA